VPGLARGVRTPITRDYIRAKVWRPSTWEDVVAAFDVLIEGSFLDFKDGASLTNSREVGKDIAAMAIFGGVIAYGVVEKNEVADSAPGVALKGQVDRIQQIADSGIVPAVQIEVTPIEDPANPGSGVIVVTVPASPNAPHCTGDRFPARSGTTTRYLSEPEIEALYRRRAAILSTDDTAVPRLNNFSGPPWLYKVGLDMSGIGVMQVTVAAIGQHRTLEYRLRPHLAKAVVDANAVASRFFEPAELPHILTAFGQWRPLEAIGWASGREDVPHEFIRHSPTFAAAFLYASGFSFNVTCPLDYHGARHVYERLWVSELVGILAIASSFYAGDPVASLLRVDISLDGLDGAKPGPGRHFVQVLSIPAYFDRGVSSTAEILINPLEGARSLLERFVTSILPDGPDVFAEVATKPASP
jgi:hypothetical protein